MAKTSNENLEERKVKALESIANSLDDINDWLYELDGDLWSERIEWYLHEFHQLAKSRTVGTSTRPERESERKQENTETQEEGSNS